MISESPVVTVHIPPNLRPYVDGLEEITASGDTVGEVLESLCRKHPAICPRFLLEDGSLKPGLAVYLGTVNIGEMQGFATPVALEELISIMSSGEPQETSISGAQQVGQPWPLDGVEHILDQQAQLGVASDLEFTVEEKGVGVFLAGNQLKVSREVCGESEVRFASSTKHWPEHAISIGE